MFCRSARYCLCFVVSIFAGMHIALHAQNMLTYPDVPDTSNPGIAPSTRYSEAANELNVSQTMHQASGWLIAGSIGPTVSEAGFGGMFDLIWGYNSTAGLIGIGLGVGGEIGSWSNSPVGALKQYANMRFVYGQHWSDSTAAHTAALGVGVYGGYPRIDRNGAVDSFGTVSMFIDYVYQPRPSIFGVHLLAAVNPTNVYVGAGVAVQLYSENRSNPVEETDSTVAAYRQPTNHRISPVTFYRSVFGEDADQRVGVEWINREYGGGRLYYGIALNDYLVVSPATVAVVRSSHNGQVKVSATSLLAGAPYLLGLALNEPFIMGFGMTLFAAPAAVLNPTLRLPIAHNRLWLVAQQRSDAFIMPNSRWTVATETALGAHIAWQPLTLDIRLVLPWNTGQVYTERTPYVSAGVYVGGL